MRTPLAYAPRQGPVGEAHPAAVAALFAAPAIVAFATWNPILLLGAAAAAIVAGLRAGGRGALALALRWSAMIWVFVVAVNAFASQRGETILVRGFELPLLGGIDVSLEALAEGGVLGLRIAIAMLAGAAAAAAVDPDGMIRLARALARRSALTAALIVRMVPLAAQDHARLGEAASLRGPGAAPVGRGTMVHRLVSGSLDRAVDAAATLELRGYALGAPRSPRRSGPRHRHSWRFATAALAMVAVAVVARALGAGGFEAYPSIVLDATMLTVLAALALPAVAALPFGIPGFGESRA